MSDPCHRVGSASRGAASAKYLGVPRLEELVASLHTAAAAGRAGRLSTGAGAGCGNGGQVAGTHRCDGVRPASVALNLASSVCSFSTSTRRAASVGSPTFSYTFDVCEHNAAVVAVELSRNQPGGGGLTTVDAALHAPRCS